MTAAEQHEDRLFARLMAGLRAMDRVTVHTDPRLAPYIDVDDVDRLVAGVAEASA